MDRPLALRWWRSQGWRQLLPAGMAVLVAIVAAVVLLGPAQRTLRVTRVSVDIAAVEEGIFQDFIPLRGEVVPRDTVYLDALEGGIVTRLLARDGDRVKKDQPLVQFGNTALELEVLQREGGLVASITALQELETRLEQDRATNERLLADAEYDVTRLQRALERREQLVARQLVSLEERDRLQDELQSALRKRDLQQDSNARQEAMRVQQQPRRREQMEKLQESLAITHDKLRNLTERAPVDGLLTGMDLKIGENRNRGTRLAEITPDTGFNLLATIDEYYLGRVREGQFAQIEHDGRPWPVRVIRVYPQVREGTFKVDLAFSGDAPVALLRGQSLQGRLSLGEDRQGLILPSGAFLGASGGQWAFVLAADGSSAQRRGIRTGRRNVEQIEVLSGLAPGERVIVSDYTGLERIDRIEFRQ
ncbi:MAG: HlyD family efflux transporter periplasmic adaptor subunit [Pseudomonadota bacterium]|nr:HlyD family efflux transporter periplasmic adaptor subunit [Pseudomonadota bacterium]